MTDTDQPTLFGSAPEPPKPKPRWGVIDCFDEDKDEPYEGFDEAGHLIGSRNELHVADLASYFTIDAAAREYAHDSYGLLDYETDTYYPPAEWPGTDERIRRTRIRLRLREERMAQTGAK